MLLDLQSYLKPIGSLYGKKLRFPMQQQSMLRERKKEFPSISQLAQEEPSLLVLPIVAHCARERSQMQ